MSTTTSTTVALTLTGANGKVHIVKRIDATISSDPGRKYITACHLLLTEGRGLDTTATITCGNCRRAK